MYIKYIKTVGVSLDYNKMHSTLDRFVIHFFSQFYKPSHL